MSTHKFYGVKQVSLLVLFDDFLTEDSSQELDNLLTEYNVFG